VVSQVVLLDAGPLGLVTNPKRSPQSISCAQWLQSLITAQIRVLLQAATRDVLEVVIATTNVGHLARFVPAERWQSITPE